jgi:hypothetical protein
MAQAPAPQQPGANSTDHQITVTGCLKPAPPAAGDATTTAGTAGATGTTGAVGAAGGSADASFVLTDAKTSSAAATDPAGASTSTSAGSQPARSAQTYRLIANPSALSPHVGKKLELTGTVEEQAASSSSTTSSSAPAGAAKGPALRVEAGKVIAASCD